MQCFDPPDGRILSSNVLASYLANVNPDPCGLDYEDLTSGQVLWFEFSSKENFTKGQGQPAGKEQLARRRPSSQQGHPAVCRQLAGLAGKVDPG